MASDKSIEVSKNNDLKMPSTPEGLINLGKAAAINLGIEQIRNGTASSQTMNYFLHADPEKDRLEKELLKTNIRLRDSQIKQIEVQTEMDKHITDAINAMKSYRPQENGDYDFDEDIIDEL